MDDRQAMIDAVLANDVRSLKRLLAAGESVNITDTSGNTPLFVAVLENRRKAFDFLLRVDNVIVDCVNHYGDTPLLIAAWHQNEYYIMELIKKGADVTIANNIWGRRGFTALHYVAFYGLSVEVAEALIVNGADLEARDEEGATPLLITVQELTNLDLVDVLLYYGANATIPNNQGVLPLSLSLSGTCDASLQEILFEYTFDNCEDEIALRSLTIAMRYAPDIFNKILDKMTDVCYDIDDLERFSDSNLRYCHNQTVEALLLKFPSLAQHFFQTDVVGIYHRHHHNFLPNTDQTKFDFFSFFCFLSKYEFMSDVVENQRSVNSPILGASITSLPEDIIMKFVFLLLSHGIQLTSTDLDLVYNFYGFSDFFKMLLHIEYVDDSNFNVTYDTIFPRIIYDLHFWKDLKYPSSASIKILKDGLRDPSVHAKVIVKLRKLFLLPPCLIKIFNEEETEVPSLLELSRNCFRDHFIRRYNIKNNVDFFTYLKWLPISEVYKEIVSFERAIYA